jgi:hypothetical protein
MDNVDQSSVERFCQAMKEQRFEDAQDELQRTNYASWVLDEYITTWDRTSGIVFVNEKATNSSVTVVCSNWTVYWI